MSDWEVGDVAVCVDARPSPFDQPMPMRVGQVSRVTFVNGPCLQTEATEGGPLSGWYSSRFRKIKPDTHEPCEEEFRILLKLSKGRVSA